jgi:hypothetical protein
MRDSGRIAEADTPDCEKCWTGGEPLVSVRKAVTSREEVRPMNQVTMWVLPLVFTVEQR